MVIEKPSEVETIGRVVEREGVDAMPSLGLRARLAARGEGRWKSSAGDRAKFGLSAAQLVEAVEWLRELGLDQRVRLLHFHIGSQITAIRPWKAALREGARLYVELARMGCPMGLFDVGGGLAVDYDGSQTNFASSRNYTEQEYANDVVWAVHEACENAELPAPDIITESGRALSAHHSMMVVEVTGTSRLSVDGPLPEPSDEEHELVSDLRINLDELSPESAVEVFHEAQSLREEMLQRFGLGLVDLPTRAACEHLFYATLERVAAVAADLEPVPEELQDLPVALADTYFCNFSVFQSAPDSWAIGQVFPVLPIHRLDEEPTERAVLGDLTCDSDGRIDRFPGGRDPKHALEVHPLREGERYLIGIFLVGAYQEILGDLHNLFGDTDAVHVDFDAHDTPFLVDRLHGETVSKVLGYVGYGEAWMHERFDRALERLVRAGELTDDEAGEVRSDLRAGLAGNTYLNEREVEEVREADHAADEDEPATPVSGTEAAEAAAGGGDARAEGGSGGVAPTRPGASPRDERTRRSRRERVLMSAPSAESIVALPKVDLHCHLDGAVRTGTILETARDAGIPLPADDVDGLRPHVQVSPDCRSLDDFLHGFEVFYPVLAVPGIMRRVAREFVHDVHADGVVHVEARFCPQLQAGPEQTAEQVLDDILVGLAEGAAATGVGWGAIVCAYRPFTVEQNEHMVDLALAARDRGVVAVDLAGPENLPGAPFAAALARAKAGGLRLTVHAGEAAGPESVREAVEVLGAERLGHGVALARDDALVADVRARGLPLECCLTSNLQTAAVADLAQHPFERLRQAGLHVTLNTDDPAVSGITLSDDYALAARTWGLGLDELRELSRAAARAAFVDDAARDELLQRIG